MQIIVYEKPGSDICAAFITNNHTKTPKTINFRGSDYILPPRSISILPDCKSLVFNTQMVTYFNVYYPLCYKQRIHILGLLKPLPPQSSQLTNLHCLKKKIRLFHNIIQETSRSQRLQTITSGRCILSLFQLPTNCHPIKNFLQSFTACLKTPLTMDGTPRGEDLVLLVCILSLLHFIMIFHSLKSQFLFLSHIPQHWIIYA